jgi:hypothetical protein
MRKTCAEEDINLLYHLSSIYESLTQTAISPITVQTPSDDAQVFCLQSKDIPSARQTVRNRIRMAREDLLKHGEYHKSLLRLFQSLDSSTQANRRGDFIFNCRLILSEVLGYAKLVSNHQRLYEEESFLYQPSCPSGKYFHSLEYRVSREKMFNPQETFKDLGEEIRAIGQLTHDSEHLSFGLPRIVLSRQGFNKENPAGSLTQRVHLNKRLLEQTGLIVLE